MKKILIILWVLIGCSFIYLGFQIKEYYDSTLTTNFNEKVLSEIGDVYVHLDRDEDLISNIYLTDAKTLETSLLYTHPSDVNKNIVSLDVVDNIIYFQAFNDETQIFDIYTLDLESKSATLSESHHTFEAIDIDLNGIRNDEAYTVIADNGSLFLEFADRKEPLLTFEGSYEEFLSPGYVPVALSHDQKYLFYTSSIHDNKYEIFIQEHFLKTDSQPMYVINLETKEFSQFFDFRGALYGIKK